MKHDENWGWSLVRWAIGLLIVSCLTLYVSFTPEMLGSKILYYVIMLSLIVIEVALVYIVVRKFFGKKK